MDRLLVKLPSSPTPTTHWIRSDSIVVGRHPYCDVVLNNNAVSREHARLTKRGDGVYVEDLHSRNGVWVNGVKIAEPTRIYSRDSLQVGDATLVFYSDSPLAVRETIRAEQLRQNSLCWRDGEQDRPNITSQLTLNSSSSFCDDAVANRRTACEYEREIRLLEERVRVLLDFARILGKADDISDLTPRFLTNILRLFPSADSACVLAPDAKESTAKRPVLKLVHYKRRDEESDEPFRVSRAIVKHVVATRSAVVSDAAFEDSRFDSSESIVRSHICSVMAAPICDVATNEILGVIQIDARKNGRRFEQDELKLLVAVANQIAVYVENQSYRDARVREKMERREMEFATQVQRGFLPIELPKVENYDFYDYYCPAKFVGGDYFDYVPLPDGKLAILLGDVSGKGISASLLMAKLSSEARYGLLLEKKYAAVMERLNRVYSENRWGDRFVTFVLAILEPETGTLRVYNAGHLYPIVAKTDGTVEFIGEGRNGFPLGVIPDATYEETVYRMAPGDAVALMSDGLPDAINSDDQALGGRGVSELFRNPDGLAAAPLGRRLVVGVLDYVGGAQQVDDQCLVVFRRKPLEETAAPEATVKATLDG
ncbi:MAG: SpoIIE family protein phosphatase [Thermoguttaceae bacterium]|nr:SpoIIE family protein phosphatase [Thermoguttaceae bacterium]